jgi:hypothetical protein
MPANLKKYHKVIELLLLKTFIFDGHEDGHL